MFGNKLCPSALGLELGFRSLSRSHTSGQDSDCICPLSVLPAGRAIGRIDAGNNTLLRPCNLKMTLQKGVHSPGLQREMELHFLLRILQFLLIGRKLLAL